MATDAPDEEKKLVSQHEAETRQFLALVDKHPHLAVILALARTPLAVRVATALCTLLSFALLYALGVPQELVTSAVKELSRFF